MPQISITLDVPVTVKFDYEAAEAPSDSSDGQAEYIGIESVEGAEGNDLLPFLEREDKENGMSYLERIRDEIRQERDDGRDELSIMDHMDRVKHLSDDILGR